MWNVVLVNRGGIGVLDWTEAKEAGLPLGDLFYAIADAASACDGYRSRLDAVRACFLSGGSRAGTVVPLRDRLAAVLGLSPEVTELAFHACWLRHAATEQRSTRSESGSFLEAARWLAMRTIGAPV
jgi:hypothetical protein